MRFLYLVVIPITTSSRPPTYSDLLAHRLSISKGFVVMSDDKILRRAHESIEEYNTMLEPSAVVTGAYESSDLILFRFLCGFFQKTPFCESIKSADHEIALHGCGSGGTSTLYCYVANGLLFECSDTP
jgi:hypothetical protein